MKRGAAALTCTFVFASKKWYIGVSPSFSLFSNRVLNHLLQYAVCALHIRTRTPVDALPMLDAHAIYILNLLLAFLQPKFDPSLQDDLMADEIEEGGAEGERSPLPSARDDEFRPFVRRLPEWQFWCVRFYFSSLRFITFHCCEAPCLVANV